MADGRGLMGESLFERARARRIRAEREALRQLEDANPGRIAVREEGEALWVRLTETPWYRMQGGTADEVLVRLEFPEYYPSTPIEAYLAEPARHPNVHPENGFVCLWGRHHAGTAVVEALEQLQRVLGWELTNWSADHLMQPEAGELARLEWRRLEVPAEYYLRRSAGEKTGTRRNRLS